MLPPEMREGGRGRVLGGANAKLFADALAQLFVDGGDAGFAVELDEGVALGHVFQFALDHGLIADEGPVEVVGESHGVEAGEIVAIDAANDAAGDEGEDEAVGEDDGARAKGGNDAVLELVEEIGGVHEGEG